MDVIIKYLIKNGAPINIKNKLDLTPLHIAIKNKMVKVIKYLLENGARIDITTGEELTPLHLVCMINTTECIKNKPETLLPELKFKDKKLGVNDQLDKYLASQISDKIIKANIIPYNAIINKVIEQYPEYLIDSIKEPLSDNNEYFTRNKNIDEIFIKTSRFQETKLASLVSTYNTKFVSNYSIPIDLNSNLNVILENNKVILNEKYNKLINNYTEIYSTFNEIKSCSDEIDRILMLSRVVNDIIIDFYTIEYGTIQNGIPPIPIPVAPAILRQINIFNPFTGKDAGIVMSNETKEKISVAKKGAPAWNKGIPLTEECKQKLSKTMTGRTSWNKGKIHSEEHKRKTSLSKIGNLNCLQYKIVGTNIETGEKVMFIGAKSLRNAGFAHTAVYMVINGQRKSHKGYTWRKESLENKLWR